MAQPRSRRVPVTDSPSLIAEAEGQPIEVILHNPRNPDGSAQPTIDVGDEDVASGAGFAMASGGVLTVQLRGHMVLFGVAPAGQSATIQILEVDV